MFKMRFSRFWKCLNTTWNLPEQPVELAQKINKGQNITLMIFLFCHYFWSLLWCNCSTSWNLWNSTSWSRLNLTVQIQLALYPCDLFKKSYRNMTGNSVKKRFVFLNIKLEVKLRFKMVYFETCRYVLPSPWIPLLTRFVLITLFAYPSNKCVIYGLELKL